MNRLITGDIVSVLAVVSSNYDPAEEFDRNYGVAVKIIGPRYTSDQVRAKIENVRMVTPKLKAGDEVSTGLADWTVLAIAGEHLWLRREHEGNEQHGTFHINDVRRKDRPEEPELLLEEPISPPALAEPVRKATSEELAEILHMKIEELAGVTTRDESGILEIQDTNGVWASASDGLLWTYVAFVPPVSEVEI